MYNINSCGVVVPNHFKLFQIENYYMNLSMLSEIGLSKGEIKIYTALINNGTSQVSKIQEKTGLERRSIYDSLGKLISKGLVSNSIIKDKKHYSITPINRLKDEINSKMQNIEKIQKLLPQVEDTYKKSKNLMGFETFIGDESIKTLFSDMLNYEDNYFIGGRWYVAYEMPLFFKQYNNKRIAKKIKWHNLLLHDSPELNTKKLIQTKTLPKEFSGSPAVIWIYGNKVAHVVWNQKFAFLMESKEIADNYKKYFHYLWKKVAK